MDSDSDVEEDVCETDKERRKTMLDAAQVDDIDNLKFKFIDDFQFKFPSKVDFNGGTSSASNEKGEFKLFP